MPDIGEKEIEGYEAALQDNLVRRRNRHDHHAQGRNCDPYGLRWRQAQQQEIASLREQMNQMSKNMALLIEQLKSKDYAQNVGN